MEPEPMNTRALAHLHSSNMPYREKSMIARWMNEARLGGRSALARAGTHGIAGVRVVRQYGESGIIGAGLGALNAHLPNGLDHQIGGRNVPLDGVGAFLSAGVAVGLAMTEPEIAASARNIGAVMFGICAFRKTNDYMAGMSSATGTNAKPKMAGEFGADAHMGAEDPILAATRNLR